MGTVRATGLVKMFGAVTAVSDLSFEAKAGGFLTLLRPSGCGQTTTLRLAPRVARAQRGARSGGRVRTIRGTVGLGELHARPAPMPSGGQQQRVALARALVSTPEVLLLDEPLSNLDARLREEMRFELREMQAKLGITSVFVTHDQAEAMTLSDRIVVMNAGRIEQEGSPEEVYQRPRTRFVMDFLGRANHLPARIRKGDDRSLVAEVEESGFCMPVGGLESWQHGQEVLLAFRPEAVEAQAAHRRRGRGGRGRAAGLLGGHR